MQTVANRWYKTLSPRLFFLAWFIIGIIQAAGTGLLDDEAYYWVYSRFLDWGYFDHPPMTAVLIKLGTVLFPGELGVRFFIVLLNTLTLVIIHAMLREKNHVLFYWIAAGMAVLQIGGILAVPDLPLVFFIACFFYVYRSFLQNKSFTNTFLLGVVMAAMLYSKYHGVLVVFFTLLSNVKLLKHYQAWLAVIIATILFIPHLVWQYQHGMPSVQYHLFERNATSYQPGYTLEYIGGQLAFMGPIIGWLLLWGAWKVKTENPFERALRWNLFGILVFFGFSTLKGRVEANWTIPVFIPLIILGHQYLHENRKWLPFIKVSAVITVVLVLVVRVYMLADVKPLAWLKKDEFHKNEERAAAIKERAAGRPVVFLNSYQGASKHWFYSGDTTLSLNTVYYRRNNFNFWPIEEQFQNRPVFVVNALLNDSTLYARPVTTVRGTYKAYNDSCFSSRMSDWLDIPVKATLTGKELVQEGLFSSGDVPKSFCAPRFPLVGGLWVGGKIPVQLLHTKLNIGWEQLRGGAVVQLTTPLPDTIFHNKQLRYGIQTSIPGVFTLNSRTVNMVEPE